MFRIVIISLCTIMFLVTFSAVGDETLVPVRKSIKIPDGRSRENIQETVVKNIKKMRKIYNRYRRKHGNQFSGKVTIKWAVYADGKVLFAKVSSSEINNTEFESDLVAHIKTWDFGKIDKDGDVTEVVYPFVFQPW